MGRCIERNPIWYFQICDTWTVSTKKHLIAFLSPIMEVQPLRCVRPFGAIFYLKNSCGSISNASDRDRIVVILNRFCLRQREICCGCFPSFFANSTPLQPFRAITALSASPQCIRTGRRLELRHTSRATAYDKPRTTIAPIMEKRNHHGALQHENPIRIASILFLSSFSHPLWHS